MKNRKGFTLVELLAVIVIMGVLLAVAIPSVLTISSKIQNNLWETKVKLLETAATQWAEDNVNTCYSNYSNLKISTLISEGYLSADDGKKFTNAEGTNISNDFVLSYVDIPDICNNTTTIAQFINEMTYITYEGSNIIYETPVYNFSASYYTNPTLAYKENVLYFDTFSYAACSSSDKSNCGNNYSYTTFLQYQLPSSLTFDDGITRTIAKYEVDSDVAFTLGTLEYNGETLWQLYVNQVDTSKTNLTATATDGTTFTITIANFSRGVYLSNNFSFSEEYGEFITSAKFENIGLGYYESNLIVTYDDEDISDTIEDASYYEDGSPDGYSYILEILKLPSNVTAGGVLKVCLQITPGEYIDLDNPDEGMYVSDFIADKTKSNYIEDCHEYTLK